MRIIISSNTSWNIYNFRFGFVQSLIKKGHKIFIITQSDHTDKFLKEIGCEMYNVNFKPRSLSLFNNFKILVKYFYISRKIKPDIIFNFTIKPNIIGNLALLFFKVEIINTITGLGNTFIKKNLVTYFILLLYYFAFKKSKVVFFQNEYDLNFFTRIKIIKKNKCKIIPGSGINFKNFNEKFFFNEENNKIIFLYIGRMIIDKGLNELIEAANIIKKNDNNVEFWFLGGFDYSRENIYLKDKILKKNEQGIIKYFPFEQNVFKYITKVSCVVLPSYREGLPRSLLEAALLKKPVIATNVPGCNQVIINNFNGFLCDSRNIISLKDSLMKFIKLDQKTKKSMGNNHYNFVKENYDENKVIKIYLNEIYKV